MKIKLLHSTVLALAVVVASTGCRHRPVGVTPIPEGAGAPVQNPGIGGTMGGSEGSSVNTGGGTQIAENGPFNPDNFTQDRDALAADTVHFAYDSAVIRDSEKANVQAVAAALQQDHSLQLLVEGNCDERGTEEYNRSLGERRSLAAREALVADGVDADRIHTISYGKDKPADPGHDEEAWSKNRRDDFVLLHPKAGM